MGKAKRLRKQRLQEEEGSSQYPAGALSYELKIARAQRHLQEAEHLIGRWIDETHKTVVEEADPEVHGAYGTWVTPPAFPSSEIALLVGDCLQCFRTALDHLAFELASASEIQFTDDLREASEFPILKPGKGGFSGRCGRKIKAVDPAAQTVIEGLQPYNRGEEFGDDPLWRLHELNRLDKHRLLHVIGFASEGVVLDPEAIENVSSIHDVKFLGGPLEAGRTQQIVRWSRVTPINPDKEAHVNLRPALHIAFDSATPAVGGTAVLDILGEVRDYIASAVLPPLAPFLR